MACRTFWVLAFLLLASTGCLSLLTERGPTGVVDHARNSFEVREAAVTYTEARIQWPDGLQGKDIQDLSGFLGDRINRVFLEELQRRQMELQLLKLVVPDIAVFSRPVSMATSTLMDTSEVRVGMWRSKSDAESWSVAIRHEGNFNVFQDTVELQLISVLTLFDEKGHTVWQGAARSPKYHDGWYSGNHLATLSARFVAEAVEDNITRMVAVTEVKPLP